MKKIIPALLIAGAATAIAVYVINKNKEQEKRIISKEDLELDAPDVDSIQVQSSQKDSGKEEGKARFIDFTEPKIEQPLHPDLEQKENTEINSVKEENFYNEVVEEILPEQEESKPTAEEAHDFYEAVTRQVSPIEEDSEVEIPNFMGNTVEEKTTENFYNEVVEDILPEQEEPRPTTEEAHDFYETVTRQVSPVKEDSEQLADTSELEIVTPEPEEEAIETSSDENVPEEIANIEDNHELDVEEVETDKPHFIAESSIGEVQSSSILSDVRYPYLDEATILDLQKQVEEVIKDIPQGKEVSVQHQVLYFDNEFLLVLIRELKKQGYTMVEEDDEHVSLQIKLLNEGDEILRNVLKISNRVHSDFSLYKGFKVIEE